MKMKGDKKIYSDIGEGPLIEHGLATSLALHRSMWLNLEATYKRRNFDSGIYLLNETTCYGYHNNWREVRYKKNVEVT